MDYSNLTESPTAPQYGFKKGLHIFEEDGYKATVSKLKDNFMMMVDTTDIDY